MKTALTKQKRRVVALFMSVIFATNIVTATIVHAVDTNLSVEDVTNSEQKVYSNATINDDFAVDRVLVVLKNAVSTSLKTFSSTYFSEIECKNVSNLTESATTMVKAKLAQMNDVIQYVPSGEEISSDNFYDVDVENFHQVLCLELSETGKENVLQAIDALMQREDVLYAGPDYVITFESTGDSDPLVNEQWAIDKIDLPEAWEIECGESTVLVGVIDSGIDGSHPDLLGRIDLEKSCDFSSDNIANLPATVDVHGHGTHVAGIIAAQGNNNIGVRGAAWNATLVSLKVFNHTGKCYSSEVAEAINYAGEQGIPILNFSGGWYNANMAWYDEALNSVIESYPGLFICSAGNEAANNDSVDHYPSNYRLDNLISVGASTIDDLRWSNSNFGQVNVDIFAPGDNILSCYPVDKCENGTYDEDTHYQNQIGYHYNSGTSMATPYVTGVAALILSKYPDLSPEEIKSRIMGAVDIVYDSEGNSVFGSLCVSGGRLNAYKAVHSHQYSGTSVGVSRHLCVCSCGVSYLERHTLRTVSMVDISGETITVTYCIFCDYEVRPLV